MSFNLNNLPQDKDFSIILQELQNGNVPLRKHLNYHREK